MSRTGKFVYACVLAVAIILAALVTTAAVSVANETPHASPTPTDLPCADESYPAQVAGTVWLAKQDTNGHWLVVSTDNLCAAKDEQALGFYPVPEWYANQIAGR